MTLEKEVAQHYTTGGLLERIKGALKAAGVDPAHPKIDDLKPVDEFHTGGIEATAALLDQLRIEPGMLVVDLGCGLGGTARHILHRYGARVMGVDLTEEYVETGRALNELLHLEEGIDLQQGSVLDLPFENDSADLVTMFHVGMNVADKDALFAEAARVLKPGGRFALFDVMRDEDKGELDFPVPWASEAALSHVAEPSVYRRAAHAAGLEELNERRRRKFTLDYFGRVLRKAAAEGAPPLGIHLLMGDTASEKLKNYVANVEAHKIAPVEMIFRLP